MSKPEACLDPDVLKDLVCRAQQGDRGAFEGLYRFFVGRVYALCLRLSGDAGQAEELTQRVFIRVWEKMETFRGESAFFSLAVSAGGQPGFGREALGKTEANACLDGGSPGSLIPGCLLPDAGDRD
jgi:hypothetical protein